MDDSLRNEFPVDWNEDEYVSRRDFFKFITLSSGGMALASIGMAAYAQIPRDRRSFEPKLIARLAEIDPGGWLQFTYPRAEDTCILIRSNSSDFSAFSRRCTHLSCPVVWQPEQGRLYCPCHEGAFSIDDGHVLQGPPARPLPMIELEVRGDEIYAIGVRSRDA
ncbi:MAG TPA: Rieske (2Fe-2S) protein [Fimbriimonadaceae bacterium]|nr:Rieske (2Fe-2S) protein [Fimbriimonadaceae bacterium]